MCAAGVCWKCSQRTSSQEPALLPASTRTSHRFAGFMKAKACSPPSKIRGSLSPAQRILYKFFPLARWKEQSLHFPLRVFENHVIYLHNSLAKCCTWGHRHNTKDVLSVTNTSLSWNSEMQFQNYFCLGNVIPFDTCVLISSQAPFNSCLSAAWILVNTYIFVHV